MMRPTRILGGGVIMALAVFAATAWRSEPGRVEGGDSRRIAVSSVVTAARIGDPDSSTTLEAPSGRLVEVVRQGLSAWGRFAVSGDLEQVAPWFSAEGPQYARFVEEATTPRVGGSAYSVGIQSPEVEEKGSRVLVSGRVTFARADQPTRTYDWTVVLERQHGSWVIWTVKDQAQATS